MHTRRSLLLILSIGVLGFTQLAIAQGARIQRDIRAIDFRNFRYPWGLAAEDSPGAFRWLRSLESGAELRDGVLVFRDNEPCEPKCPTLEIQQITYEDTNGDGRLDATVTLVYNSGGQMTMPRSKNRIVSLEEVKADRSKDIPAIGASVRLVLYGGD